MLFSIAILLNNRNITVFPLHFFATPFYPANAIHFYVRKIYVRIKGFYVIEIESLAKTLEQGLYV